MGVTGKKSGGLQIYIYIYKYEIHRARRGGARGGIHTERGEKGRESEKARRTATQRKWDGRERGREWDRRRE